MRKKALAIIRREIGNFDLLYKRKDNWTDCALHLTIGKIGLSAELGLITLEEADNLIDRVFEKYGRLELN